MAEAEKAPAATQKRTESITICVTRCKELKGQRGDQLTAVFKLEYGEKTLGESQKIDTQAGQKQFDVGFTSTFPLNVEDSTQLDEICYKPFACTILEMLPREKKQKDDKFVTLGQCTFDIFPILQGSLTHEVNLPVHSVVGSPLEHLKPDEPRPEITVTISVNEAIFTEAEAGQFNIMRVVVGSLYAPPEAWQAGAPQQQQPYVYCAAMPAPFSTDKDQALVFSAGTLKPGADKEPPDRRLRWYQAHKMAGGSQFVPDSQLPSDPIDQEDGDFKGKDDLEFRRVAEQERPRVWWNTERRCFIDQGVEKRLQDRIAQCRYWPLEIFRLQAPSTSAQKKGGPKVTEEECLIGFHGVAYLNLAHLLYPGVKRIRGVFKVEPFYETEAQEKAKVKGTLIGDVTKQLFGIVRMNSGVAKGGKPGDKKDPTRRDAKEKPADLLAAANAPAGTKAAPQGKAGAPGQPAQANIDPSAARKEGETQSVEEINPEGQLYREARSYVYIDITLQRALVKKRTKEEQLVRVSDIIPPRPLYPRKVCGADRAVTDYRKQIAVVAGQVVEEFRNLFADELSSGTYDTSHDAVEGRRTQLVQHLSETGRYYIFRERLKYAIVKIVREKYLRTGAFENEDEYQAFLSDLYTYLVDEMRTALNEFLDVDSSSLDMSKQSSAVQLPTNFTLGSEQLKQFAREAEIVGDYELANRYYQERLARDRADADSWFDYGIFAMSMNEFVKAEECFRECLSISRTHLDGLTMCGVVSTLLEEHQLALTCFETVTVLDPENLVAWTLLGLYYEAAGNDIGMEMAYGEAERLSQAKHAAILAQLQPQQTTSQPVPQATTPSLLPGVPGTVPLQLDPAVQQQPVPAGAEGGDKHLAGPIAPVPPAGAAPGKAAKKPPGQASNQSSSSNAQRPSVVGSLNFVSTGKFMPRTEANMQEGKVEYQTIFMHTALYLLHRKAYAFTERALAHHMLHPSGGSSPNYLEVIAKLCYEKRELTAADHHITEALKVNYRKADAWALCGHIKFRLGDDVSARQSYERSLAFESDPFELQEIYIRLGIVYLKQEEFQRARDTFLLACKRQPSAVTWLGVGIGCYRLEQYADAESALCEANLLNNYDPVIWAYLSLVSLKTGRRLEAEQAYKFSRKLRLKDEKLLNELHLVQTQLGFGNPEFATTH